MNNLSRCFQIKLELRATKYVLNVHILKPKILKYLWHENLKFIIFINNTKLVNPFENVHVNTQYVPVVCSNISNRRGDIKLIPRDESHKCKIF